MERCGPPRTITFALPLTDIAGLAVWCRITSGVGMETGFTPQAAVAVMVTVGLGDTMRENDMGTASLTVTLIYGNGVVSDAGSEGTAGARVAGKLTLTLPPVYPLNAAYLQGGVPAPVVQSKFAPIQPKLPSPPVAETEGSTALR